MNMGTVKTYQDLILEFSKTPRGNVEEFTKKYNEVLKGFLNLKEVYTIASKSATIEEVKNNTAKPLCSMNQKKMPCMWFFSQREMAQKFVNHFGFVKDGTEYIRTIKNDEIVEVIKKAVFNGIFQFSIDEGKCAMVITAYDLLNMHFEISGEEKILERSQYQLMIIFTMMKFHGKLLYAVEGNEKAENGKTLLATDREGVLHFFAKKEDSDIHKYDIGYGRNESKVFNIIGLTSVINAMVDKVDEVKFEIAEDVIAIKTKKLAYILNEMIKINK